MLEMNSRTIRFLSRMGARGVLGQTVYDYVEDGKDLYVMSADLARASGFDRVRNKYSDRIINVGIAEQNMIGMAAGLSAAGTPVIATTWATFASARVADQVRNFMGFMRANIKLVGMDSGLAASRFGYTHSNSPDIAIMRAIPGIKVISPCDGLEIYMLIKMAIEYDGPVYIRLTDKANLPVIYKEPGISFEIGRANRLQEGKDIAIIACGTIIQNVLEASAQLKEKGLSVKVIDMHTIVPLDLEALEDALGCSMIVTVEDHLRVGGLGSAVSEYLVQKKSHPSLLMLGIENGYLPAGRQSWAEQICGLDSTSIADRIWEEFHL